MDVSRPDPARRNERARQAILRVARELCLEVGYLKLSIEAIAARAGVGKQTIYRWWPSKGAVMLEALGELTGVAVEFPDTGDVLADLRAQMTGVVRQLNEPSFKALYSGLIGAAQSEPELARTLFDVGIRPRAEAACRRLARAQEHHQLRTDFPVEDMVELLYGSFYYRLLLHNRPITPDLVDAILALAFEGLKPRPPARKPRRPSRSSARAAKSRTA
jgi:AcrR family transcriptional regulator